jgi:hypothetical protein
MRVMVLGVRWRRDGWLVGSLVLAVLIVVVAARYPWRDGEPVATPSDSVPSVAPLPDGVLSRAELVYACVQGCRPVVVFLDGREFEVPTDASSTREVTLSPDGRWLGYPLGTGFVVRDLLGHAELRTGSDAVDRRLQAWAWTPDSSQLLLAEVRDGRPEAFVLLRVGGPPDGAAWLGTGPPGGGSTSAPANGGPNVGGGTTEVAAWPGHDIIGVRSPAELLTIRPDLPSGTRVEAGLSNPAGTIERWFTVEAAAHLRPGERIEPTSLRFSGSGYDIVVLDASNGPVAVLRFAGPEKAGSPGEVSRFDLTGPGAGRWSVLGVGADGRAFVRNGPGGTEVWYLVGDGSLRPGRALAGDAVVVTPGTARN